MKNKNKNNDDKRKKNDNDESNESLSSYDVDKLLLRKIEILYKVAVERMVRKFGFKRCEATRAVLLKGSVFGEETNILNNILKNSLEVVHHNDDGQEPIFQNISELVRCSMQALINIIVHHPSKPSKKDVILFLLQSEVLSPDDSGDEKDDDDEDEDVDIVGNNGKEKKPYGSSGKDLGIDLGKMLKLGMNIISLCGRLANNFIPNLLSNFEDVSNFKDWLIKVYGKDERRELVRKLAKEVVKFDIKVNKKKKWAIKIVLNAAKKVNDSGLLLQELRYQRDILKEKKKKEEEVEEWLRSSYNLRLSEMKNFLMKTKNEIRIQNELKREIENINMKYKSKIFEYDLNYFVTQKSIIETKKKERKMVNICEDGEKIIEEFKRKMEEEKRKIEVMGKRQKELNDNNDAILVKLKRTRKEKEQACTELMNEKRIYKIIKDNSNNKLASVRREIDMKFQQSIEEEKRLELELFELLTNSASSSSFAITKAKHEHKYKYQRSKTCMICSESDVNIVFLPCAHQVICSICKEHVYFALEDRCPCCDRFIQKAIKIFGLSD